MQENKENKENKETKENKNSDKKKKSSNAEDGSAQYGINPLLFARTMKMKTFCVTKQFGINLIAKCQRENVHRIRRIFKRTKEKRRNEKDQVHLRIVISIGNFGLYEIITEMSNKLTIFDLKQIVFSLHCCLYHTRLKSYYQFSSFTFRNKPLSQMKDSDIIPLKKDCMPYFIGHLGIAYQLTIRNEYLLHFGVCTYMNPEKPNFNQCPFIRQAFMLSDSNISMVNYQEVLNHLAIYDHFEYFDIEQPRCNGNDCVSFRKIYAPQTIASQAQTQMVNVNILDKIHIHSYCHIDFMDRINFHMLNNLNLSFSGLNGIQLGNVRPNIAYRKGNIGFRYVESTEKANKLARNRPRNRIWDPKLRGAKLRLLTLMKEVIDNQFEKDLMPLDDKFDFIQFFKQRKQFKNDFAALVLFLQTKYKIFKKVNAKMNHDQHIKRGMHKQIHTHDVYL